MARLWWMACDCKILLQHLSDDFIIKQLNWKDVLKANMYEKTNSNFTKVLRWKNTLIKFKNQNSSQ